MPELNINNVNSVVAQLKKRENRNEGMAFNSVGSSSHSFYERSEHDLYTTDQNDFIRFLKALIKRDKFELKFPILEPASGLGDLVEVLQKMYKGDVIACDIENRENWDNFKSQIGKMQYRDFLKDDFSDLEFNTILTNPPFVEAANFVRRGTELLKEGQNLILLLRIQWLETIERYKLFQTHPYKYVYVYTKRASCYNNGIDTNSGSMACYGWFIYEKGWQGEPVIRFIE